MLAKGKGPAYGGLLRELEPIVLCGGPILVPTRGTTVSGGHTTLGDLNCTWELLEEPLGAPLAAGSNAPRLSGTLLELLGPSENKTQLIYVLHDNLHKYPEWSLE